MKAAILGLGESLIEYDPYKFEDSFGVNDIESMSYVRNLICLEPCKVQRTMTHERIKVIKESNPVIFYTNETGWEKYHNNVKRLSLIRNIKLSDLSKTPCSNNSPFVATAIALQKGFKEVVLFGVDFKTHWQLSNYNQIKRILKDYRILNEQAEKLEAKIYVSSNKSVLSKVLPIWRK